MTGFVFSQDTRDLIRLLAVHKVRYLIVGGMAALEKNKKSLGRYKDLDDLLFIRPAKKKVEERKSVIARSTSKRRLP